MGQLAVLTRLNAVKPATKPEAAPDPRLPTTSVAASPAAASKTSTGVPGTTRHCTSSTPTPATIAAASRSQLSDAPVTPPGGTACNSHNGASETRARSAAQAIAVRATFDPSTPTTIGFRIAALSSLPVLDCTACTETALGSRAVRPAQHGPECTPPLFGIANQLLAAIALTVCTTLLIKHGKLKWAWVTGIPLAWDATVTLTASGRRCSPTRRPWASSPSGPATRRLSGPPRVFRIATIRVVRPLAVDSGTRCRPPGGSVAPAPTKSLGIVQIASRGRCGISLPAPAGSCARPCGARR